MIKIGSKVQMSPEDKWLDRMANGCGVVVGIGERITEMFEPDFWGELRTPFCLVSSGDTVLEITATRLREV